MSRIREYCQKWVDADGPHGNEQQIYKKDPIYKLYRVIEDDEARLAAAHQETHSCVAFDRTGEPYVIDQARLDAACAEIDKRTAILSNNRRCMSELDDLMQGLDVPLLRGIERQIRHHPTEHPADLEEMARKAKEILAEARGL